MGETFTFYMFVINESEEICSDIAVKIDVQTQTQRITLQSKMGDAQSELFPGKSSGQMVMHEIKETGQHM